MAYKQSPFPLIEGTSPVKQKVKLIKMGIDLAKKGYKAAKNLLTKTKTTSDKIVTPPGPPKSHLIGGQKNVPWDPTIRQELKPYQLKTKTTSVKKVNRTPTKEYRWNEPQRGARNPDGTRR